MTISPKLHAQHPTVAEIDLAAFSHNIKSMKKIIKAPILLAVIKTNAYGHGIVPIGQAAVRAGADRLGVTTVQEGALLRESGVDVPIQLLSSIVPEQVKAMVAYRLTASVSSEKIVEDISKEAVRQKRTVPAHIKIDTGLHRFGINPNEAVAICQSVYPMPGIEWEGIYTHFSHADDGDWKTTENQFSLFMDTVEKLREKGFDFPVRHVGGSTVAIERSDMHLDMVRPGISLFGYPPDPRQEGIVSLKPVLKLKSKILQIHELPCNIPIGYGGTYVTSSTEKIAIVPIGHGDGYQRRLSDKGQVLVKGKRAAIVGRISLDQLAVNVSAIPDVAAGDEVVLIGKQGSEEITAREVGTWMDSIVDEVLASLTERIPRVYV